VCGCGVLEDVDDNDGDGTLNCSDGCPSDNNKNQPGVCGCGVLEGVCGNPNKNGLLGTYFSDTTLTTRRFARVDRPVSFDWLDGSCGPFISGPPFSIRWTGFVQADSSDTYTFTTVTDDGVNLWVNEVQLIADWTSHGALEQSGAIALQAGQRYSIRMEYYNGGGPGSAQLLWSNSVVAKQVIAETALFYE
jgi:hypothetical protein